MDTADSRATPAGGEAMKKADDRKTDHPSAGRSINEGNSNAVTAAVGAASREHAATVLREMARQNRKRAQERMREARSALDHLMAAEVLFAKAAEQEALADQAHRLGGRAEEALWNLAVESERKGV